MESSDTEKAIHVQRVRGTSIHEEMADLDKRLVKEFSPKVEGDKGEEVDKKLMDLLKEYRQGGLEVMLWVLVCC